MLVLENVEHENYVNNLCLTPLTDAIHIAVASAHGMDYLVTWNFKHIANPFIQDRLRKTVQDFGFHFPVMCSPEELLQNNEDN